MKTMNEPTRIEHIPLPLCAHGKIRCGTCRDCTAGHYERRPIPDAPVERCFTVGKFVPLIAQAMGREEAPR